MSKALFANNAKSTLAAGITDVATSLSVAAGHGARFPSPSGGDWFLATLVDTSGNIEIVKVTARTTDAFTTIVRAQEGTTAIAFASASKCELRVTKGTMERIPQTAGLTANRVPYADSSGNLVDDANHTYDGTTFKLGVTNFTVAQATGNTVIAGTLTQTGVATFTAAPVMSALTASRAVFTDGSKALTSNAITGTGNVVMSASPTLTGTIAAASQTLSGTLAVTGTSTLTGNVGVGAGSAASVGVFAQSSALVGTSQFGVRSSIVGASDATAAIIGVMGNPNTAAASFTCTEMAAFYADASTKGAGSTITNHFGFHATANINQGGTLNAAFRGEVAAAATRYNLYMDGTADNHVNGNFMVGGTAARSGTAGTNKVNIFDGTAPTGTLANGTSLYSTAGELRVMDAAGNATLLSPHDGDRNWIHQCAKGDGNEILLRMEQMAELLAEKFGDEFAKRFGVPFAEKSTFEDIETKFLDSNFRPIFVRRRAEASLTK